MRQVKISVIPQLAEIGSNSKRRLRQTSRVKAERPA
jgi:hypothetical protein